MLILLALMAFADLFWIVSQKIQLTMLKNHSNSVDYRVSSGVTLMMASCLFSLSHWVFCFKYYTAARRLTLLLNNENPKKDDLKLNIVNIIFTALNILIPALYAWSYTVQAKPNQSTVFVWFYVSSTINLFLQFVSLAILSMALYNIKY